MSSNRAAGTPVGGNQMPLYGSPAEFKAVEQYTYENATASSVISLTDNTTAIEVTAGGTAAFVRWVPATETAAVSPFASVIAVAGTTANYDFVIPPNTVRRLVVPVESAANKTVGATATSVVGQRVEYGLFARVAVKSAGIASVMLAEYGNSNSY